MRTNGVIAPCDLARIRTLLHPRKEPGPFTRLFLFAHSHPTSSSRARPNRMSGDWRDRAAAMLVARRTEPLTQGMDKKTPFEYSESRHKG